MSSVLLPSRMQIRLNMIGMDGLDVDPAFGYVL